MTPLIQQARERAPYYREWAKDIRGNNGTSVDADHADGTADLLDRLATALSSAEEEKQRAVSEEREACALIIDKRERALRESSAAHGRGHAARTLALVANMAKVDASAIRSRSLNAGKQEAGDAEGN